MPRYVLIEFENNEQAERFVARTLDRELKGAAYKVVGFFAKPRGFCKCGHLTDRKQALETARGSKYGWRIHTPCGRPRREIGHTPRNLLDPEGTPVSRATAFLNLAGTWLKASGEPPFVLPNYPINVITKDTDK